MKTLYYIEKDGQVFLVKKGEMLCLPEKKEIPFKIKSLRPMDVGGPKVFFCEPVLPGFPKEWIYKDALPGMDKADRLARLAANRSLVRHVSEAIIPQEGRVLMVKSNRGFTQGLWSLPGGFITFGESPPASLVREVKEETGLDVKVASLFHVSSLLVRGHYFIAFFYLCTPVGGRISPDPSEIQEVAWMPLDQAILAAKKLFIRKGLELYKKSLEKK